MPVATWGGSRTPGCCWRGALECCAGAGLWTTEGVQREAGPSCRRARTALGAVCTVTTGLRQPAQHQPCTGRGAAASPQDQAGGRHSK